MANPRPDHVPGTQSDEIPGPQRARGGAVATGERTGVSTSRVRDRKEVRHGGPEKPCPAATALGYAVPRSVATPGFVPDQAGDRGGLPFEPGSSGPTAVGCGESHHEAVRRDTPTARALLAAIALYQAMRRGYVSPCRFYPSCSTYASEAIRAHGASAGTWLSVRRVFRCRPGGPSGYDPVPDPAPRFRS